MKTLQEYLEGIDPGDKVPSIRGVVTKIKTPKEEGKSKIVTLGNKEGQSAIDLYFKPGSPIFTLLVKAGDTLSITCNKNKSGGIEGMTLKEGKSSNYIVVEDGAVFNTVKDPVNLKELPTLADEPLTAADSAIDNYVLDRLYVFKRVALVVTDCGGDYPLEKLSELATSAHIELSRAGIKPRPTTKQLERKEVHKTKEKSVTEKKQFSESDPLPFKIDWKQFKHPASGVLLGSEKPEKMAAVYYPWYLRQEPGMLDSKARSLYDALTVAFEDLKLEPIDAYGAYIVNYVNEYLNPKKGKDLTEGESEKLSNRTNQLIDKFEKKLQKEKYVADGNNITNKEAKQILINFSKIWKELIEDEEE